MQYRINSKNGDKLSVLGFGCMRFPMVKGQIIDEPKAIELVREAYAKGVNYFDTAYVYQAGLSEEVTGKAIAPFRREVKLATKLPIIKAKSGKDFETFFRTSLTRLGTDYIDYYLVHCILSWSQYQKMVAFGLKEWIAAKKQSGEIVNIGFSFHGKGEDFIKVLDDYPWDFTQIQYNYMDTAFQAGRVGLEYAYAKGVPVIIMEPLRGGGLVNRLPETVKSVLEAAVPQRTLADWGLRWVLNHKETLLLLSGMGSEEMLAENLATAETALAGSMSAAELAAIDEAINILSGADRIPCTACGYCMPCPKGVDIPACFAAYNNKSFAKKRSGARANYLSSVGALSATPGLAGFCVKCRACEKNCPQGIAISNELARVKKTFEFAGLKTCLALARKFFK